MINEVDAINKLDGNMRMSTKTGPVIFSGKVRICES